MSGECITPSISFPLFDDKRTRLAEEIEKRITLPLDQMAEVIHLGAVSF